MKKILLLVTVSFALNATAQNRKRTANPELFPVKQHVPFANKIKQKQSKSFIPKTKLTSPNSLVQVYDSVYSWSWDSTSVTWILYSKTDNFIFDANYNIAGYNVKDWDAFTLSWMNANKYTNTFDANNNLIEAFVYDSNNNIIQDIKYSSGTPSENYLITYNSNNKKLKGLK